MKLFVLGATGKTGGALVTQAVERGHGVTTFGRRAPPRAALLNERALVGDPMDADALAAAMSGHDAILSVLGTRGLGATSVLRLSSRATLAAMRRARVARLVIVSSALLDHDIGRVSRLIARTVLRHHSADQRAMESQVTASDTEWTVLRPPRMSDGAPAGPYVLTEHAAPVSARGMLIAKDEVARAMLDIVESGRHVREIVWLRGAVA